MRYYEPEIEKKIAETKIQLKTLKELRKGRIQEHKMQERLIGRKITIFASTLDWLVENKKKKKTL